MRRLIALALVAALSAGGLSACGKSEEQKRSEKSDEVIKRLSGTYKKPQQ